MRISFEFDTEDQGCLADIAAAQIILESCAAMLTKGAAEDDPKKEKTTLKNTEEILKDPVAPVQQKKTETKKLESENIKPEREKKSQKRETKSQESETKKAWSPKQKADINAIREAYEKQKKEKEKLKTGEKLKAGKRGRTREDIDNTLIVYMIDVQGRKFKDIAKELGCCEQTVRNRYEVGKRDSKEKSEAV